MIDWMNGLILLDPEDIKVKKESCFATFLAEEQNIPRCFLVEGSLLVCVPCLSLWVIIILKDHHLNECY